jgi:hypothetical protein
VEDVEMVEATMLLRVVALLAVCLTILSTVMDHVTVTLRGLTAHALSVVVIVGFTVGDRG